jgi:hypothetical protein
MELFRPVGKKELDLIIGMNYRGFPPRLPDQPIFYPVLNVEYAREIASRWNTEDEFSGYCGFVTGFEINGNYLGAYEIQTVGSSLHQEYWIPAGDLPAFNSHILGTIKVLESFYGKKYAGPRYPFDTLA